MNSPNLTLSQISDLKSLISYLNFLKLKKAASILLLMVFLFNTIGYKAIFFYLEQEADLKLEAEIKNMHELDSRLIAVKIPINLPYQTDWREFESTNGEMTFKGKTYKYVKLKVLRDTLILLCIDHAEKSQLQKNSADYFERVNDLDSKANKNPVLKQSKIDFYQEVKDLFTPQKAFPVDHHLSSNYSLPLSPGYLQKPETPPRKHTA